MNAAAELARLQPEPWAALAPVVDMAWTMADRELLSLVLTRAAQLTGSSDVMATLLPPPRDERAARLRTAVASWPTDARLSEPERAGLAFVEQLMIDPDAVGSDLVDGLLTHLDPAEVLAFASAVYVLDAQARVLTVANQLLTGDTP